jgi:hypothetical protein
MNEHQILESFDDGDVISFNNERGHLCKKKTLREVFPKIVVNKSWTSFFSQSINEELGIEFSKQEDLFTGKKDCEILREKSPRWRKGKLRFRFILEFIPDTPESPTSELDDIRKAIQNDQQ